MSRKNIVGFDIPCQRGLSMFKPMILTPIKSANRVLFPKGLPLAELGKLSRRQSWCSLAEGMERTSRSPNVLGVVEVLPPIESKPGHTGNIYDMQRKIMTRACWWLEGTCAITQGKICYELWLVDTFGIEFLASFGIDWSAWPAAPPPRGLFVKAHRELLGIVPRHFKKTRGSKRVPEFTRQTEG